MFPKEHFSYRHGKVTVLQEAMIMHNIKENYQKRVSTHLVALDMDIDGLIAKLHDF